MNSAADETAAIELSELRLGNIVYSIAVFPSNNRFVTAWRCPVCERRQGCWYSTKTHLEAARCAEEEVLKHHTQFHGESLPG
jgi:hypothetical protein